MDDTGTSLPAPRQRRLLVALAATAGALALATFAMDLRSGGISGSESTASESERPKATADAGGNEPGRRHPDGSLSARTNGDDAGPAAASGPKTLDVFPKFPAAVPITLDGSISVNGRSLDTSIFRTRSAPAEVIAFYRTHFEREPVDLGEDPLPDGRSLAILDVPRDRQLLVTARSSGSETEVLLSASPLSAGDAAEPPAGLPELPADLVAFSRVDDRSGGSAVITWSAAAPRGAEALAQDLRARFRAAGWEGGEIVLDRDRGEDPIGLRFERGGDEVFATVGTLADETVVTLRVQADTP